jgi:hypothetical protein
MLDMCCALHPSPDPFLHFDQSAGRGLRPGLLLLLLPQRAETDTRDLDDLETDTGNITLGLALATETSEEDLVVLIDEVEATVVGDCV